MELGGGGQLKFLNIFPYPENGLEISWKIQGKYILKRRLRRLLTKVFCNEKINNEKKGIVAQLKST